MCRFVGSLPSGGLEETPLLLFLSCGVQILSPGSGGRELGACFCEKFDVLYGYLVCLGSVCCACEKFRMFL